MKIIICSVMLILAFSLSAFEITGDTHAWEMEDFIGFDEVGDCSADFGDITSTYVKLENNKLFLRVTFDDMVNRKENQVIQDNFINTNIKLLIEITDNNKTNFNYNVDLNKLTYKNNDIFILRTQENNLLELSFDWNDDIEKKNLDFKFEVMINDVMVDQYSASGAREYRGGNAAFVHHGNQGLTYTEVFYGQDPIETSGFDEVLEVHQLTGIPGNFHMSGTLMPAAEWHNPEFNDWLVSGVNDGYVAMLSSALGQHIMPFVQNDMNDWSVSIESDMVEFMYGYTPHVAWVPERVWLAPGNYPDAGVIDWLGDNWTQHGINAVILDDWPHANGADNRKIHWMNNGEGIFLRVIPINNDFVGEMHYDANAAKTRISGVDGIAVYGTDWEVAAEMNEHNGTMFLDNYESVLWYCHDNYPGINVWKLDDAITESNFNGDWIDVQNGTYGLLGGSDGYGGSNNSWYTNWAAAASHSDFHTPTPWTYGYIWDNVYNNLMTAPNNDLAQLGWYTMMINLHETGWHDGDPPEISGWEHRYSSHIKNGHVFAEAARWANGDYTETTACYFNDIDQDGVDELVIHNDKAFYVFESIGGKANWVFYKDGYGNAYSVVGSDVSYWSETDGDYNESSYNHFAAFSDVSPDMHSSVYDMTIDIASGNMVRATLDVWGVEKTIQLETGNPYLDVTYNMFEETGYIKSGWTPDLLDIIWSGKSHLQRMWGDYGSYCGQRNSASGATIALVLGDGGASHNGEFEGTLVKGDEISGYDIFKVRLYAGYTSDPYDMNYNKVVELDTLAAESLDEFSPELYEFAQIIDNNTIQISFNEGMDDITGENIANYQLSGFTNSYTIYSIERQDNWNLFFINLNENLVAGDEGDIVVNNIEDLNGNTVAPNSSTNLEVPNGITPHHIFIDGTNDFDQTTERIQANTDTLFITWDEDYLYLGFESMTLDSLGDFFVNLDVNQNDTLGATTGSWSRVDFSGNYLPEYQIAIEGGGGSIQLNSWSEARGWTYSHYPANGCSSYEGWMENPYTEISIPWNGLGNPTSVALSIHSTEEDNEIVSNIFPTNNPIGDHPTIVQAFMFYLPEISGEMPLMDFEPYNVNYSEIGNLVPPENVTITIESDSVHISWNPVFDATSYKVFSSDDPYSAFTEDMTGIYDGTNWSTTNIPIKKFYYVKAMN